MGDFRAQHYRMIARRLAESKQHFSEMLDKESPREFRNQITTALSGVYQVERRMIELFEADNSNFDKTEFQAASESSGK